MIPLTDPTLPSPPFLYCPKLANLRDVGGYPLSSPTNPSARSVRRGLLYRSADPSYVDTEGFQILTSAGVKRVYDLRSQPEIDRQGKEWEGVQAPTPLFWTRDEASSPKPTTTTTNTTATVTRTTTTVTTVIKTTTTTTTTTTTPEEDEEEEQKNGIERVWTPVFAAADYGPEKIGVRYQAYTRGAEGFRVAYRDILEAAGVAYGRILRDLAGPGPEGALVHCSAGKDRTGLLVAVLYGLLGVEDRVVCAEYALTDRGLRLMKPVFKERLLRNEALRDHPEGVESMISSNEENMRLTLDMIKEVWGGAEGYLREVVGLTDEEIAGLRRNFESEEEPVL